MRRLAPGLALLALVLFARSASAADAPACLYEIGFGDPVTLLDAEITCDDPSIAGFAMEFGGAAAWMESFALADGRQIEPTNGLWQIPADAERPLKLRYRLNLGGMAEANQNYDSALKIGGSVMADVGGWLAVPVGKNDGRYELGFRFAPPAGSDYATAMPLVDGYHRLDAGDILYAGPLLLGKFERRSLDLPGPLALAPDSADPTRRAQVDLAFLDGLGVADADQLASWIGDTAQVNAGFWQGFPVAQSLVIVLPVDGRGLPFGRVLNRGGVTTLLLVGKESPVAELYQEWVLIHEFLHLGTPFIRDRGSWFNEGIATFYEPIVRFRAGWKSEDEVWLEWLGMMERGLPAMGEVGLSEARGGGVYWGGALYWLLAEIAERARSDLKHGAEDGLRALLIESGAIDAFDRTGSATATMDRALKGSTFGDLADAHVAGKGPPIDLQDLWARLGVAIGPDGKIVYDDNAPLAAVRAAIVAGGPAEGPKAGPGLVPVSAQ